MPKPLEQAIYDGAGRMVPGLKNNKLEEIIPTGKQLGIADLEKEGVQGTSFFYYEYGRDVVCVVEGYLIRGLVSPNGECFLQDVGVAHLAEGDQPNIKIGKALARTRAVRHMLDGVKKLKERNLNEENR